MNEMTFIDELIDTIHQKREILTLFSHHLIVMAQTEDDVPDQNTWSLLRELARRDNDAYARAVELVKIKNQKENKEK
jgi:hypothetical protein